MSIDTNGVPRKRGRPVRRLALAALTLLISGQLLAKPLNIVLMVGDDVGFSDLGSYGSEIHTPNLDALAAEGSRFSNFHTTASCSPTRAMLMTGVDNHRNGLGNMLETMPAEHEGMPGYDGVLNDKVVTMAELLRDNGYHTYHTGKWHLGHAPEKRPYARGFERTIALGSTGADNWEQRTYLPIYKKAHWYADGEEHQLPDDFYSSKYFVDKTIEFIDSNKGSGRPFFSYIAFQAVHIPVQAPREFTDKYLNAYQQGWDKLREQRADSAKRLGLIPENAKTASMSTFESWQTLSAEEQAEQQRRMALYAGMLDAMDFHIGRLVSHLKAIGEYDNTIFVFLSDNGPEPSNPMDITLARLWIQATFNTDPYDPGFGEKGSYSWIGPGWASASASPGYFYKFFAGEGGLRVPLIIRLPPALQASTQQAIVPSFAHVKDVLPTLLALTGTPDHQGVYKERPVESITGKSLLPVMAGKAERTHPKYQPIGYELAGNAALFKGDYKLMKNLQPFGDGEWHLYNIQNDPGETQDLRHQQPLQFKNLLADYQQYAERNGVLEMPRLFDYRQQVQAYGFRNLLPVVMPWIGLIALSVFGIWLWRKRWRQSAG